MPASSRHYCLLGTLDCEGYLATYRSLRSWTLELGKDHFRLGEPGPFNIMCPPGGILGRVGSFCQPCLEMAALITAGV